MKLTKALAAAVTAFAIGVPVAGAAPDGYQPQLKATSQPDGYQPQLKSTSQPDAFIRYLRNNQPQSGGAVHPDSRSVRFTVAGPATPVAVDGDDGRDLTTGLIGALLGAFAAVLGIAGASTIRGRRRLAGAS